MVKQIAKRLWKETGYKCLPPKLRGIRNRSGYSSDIAEKVKIAEQYILEHQGEYENNSTLRYIVKYGLSDVFNDTFVSKYITYKVPKIIFDKDVGMYYLVYKNEKMYFPKSFSSVEKVKKYFINIMMEQDTNSPHNYGVSAEINENTIIIDAGAAEGFFSLDHVKTAKRIIIIECDGAWVCALKKTFEPYKDKVVVIEKFLCNKNDETCITLDEITRQTNAMAGNVVVKMDLEGGEYLALQGGKDSIRGGNICISATVYHNVGDEEQIRKLVEKDVCKFECSNGYMFFAPRTGKFVEPYLTHGVLRIYS